MPLKYDVRHDALASGGPFVNEGTASMAGEIKPLEHWRRLDEMAANMVGKALARRARPIRWLAATDEAPPRPARAPFPARALRDRPWDISALVEE